MILFYITGGVEWNLNYLHLCKLMRRMWRAETCSRWTPLLNWHHSGREVISWWMAPASGMSFDPSVPDQKTLRRYQASGPLKAAPRLCPSAALKELHMASSCCLDLRQWAVQHQFGGRRPSISRPIRASRSGRWPDDTAAELGGPVSFTRAGSFLFSEAGGGERRHGRAAASVLAQVRRCCTSWVNCGVPTCLHCSHFTTMFLQNCTYYPAIRRTRGWKTSCSWSSCGGDWAEITTL